MFCEKSETISDVVLKVIQIAFVAFFLAPSDMKLKLLLNTILVLHYFLKMQKFWQSQVVYVLRKLLSFVGNLCFIHVDEIIVSASFVSSSCLHFR